MKCYRCNSWPCGCPDGCTIIHGDCRDVLAELSGQSVVDAVITDPPYGITARFGQIHMRRGYGDGRSNGVRKLQFEWDGSSIVDVVRAGLSAAFRLCKPQAGCFVWVGFDTAERYAEPARRAKFRVKPAVWVKKHPPPAGFKTWWPSAFELAYYGYRRGAWFGDENVKRSNVWVADSYRHGQPGKVSHPTQKPLELVNHHVQSIVPPDGVVIDPFMGSGTTLVAAKMLGRRAIGIELEEKYCKLAAARLQQGALFGIA